MSDTRDSIKSSVISDIADLIADKGIICAIDWQSVCYQVPDMDVVYNVNEDNLYGCSAFSDGQDLSLGIDNILKTAYDINRLDQIFKVIIETDKLNYGSFLCKGSNAYVNQQDEIAFSENGDMGVLNDTYKKFIKLLNLLDLDFELYKDSNYYKFRLNPIAPLRDHENILELNTK